MAKRRSSKDVARAASNLDGGPARGDAARIQVPYDVGYVGLVGVADMPHVEAVKALQQASLESRERAADSHHAGMRDSISRLSSPISRGWKNRRRSRPSGNNVSRAVRTTRLCQGDADGASVMAP